MPDHTSQVAMTTVNECEFEILPHLPYSPDMAPPDFYLFPKLKSHLRGTQPGSNVRKKMDKVQESIQSSTTPDPGCHMGK